MSEDYGKTCVELFKLKLIDKSVNQLSSVVFISVIIFVYLFAFIVVNIGLAFWLGEIIGKPYYGFFGIAAFYAFLGFILQFFLRFQVQKKIHQILVTYLYL